MKKGRNWSTKRGGEDGSKLGEKCNLGGGDRVISAKEKTRVSELKGPID